MYVGSCLLGGLDLSSEKLLRAEATCDGEYGPDCSELCAVRRKVGAQYPDQVQRLTKASMRRRSMVEVKLNRAPHLMRRAA